ncbi:MAG: formylglycine-generating enzyme family protein [Planctomycetales bacterium]|jgi:formylglycine-generating enzyme required for sulfatase activity|nr:formylglycine-generating enzyme family protein [Planctomycetales bacterium]
MMFPPRAWIVSWLTFSVLLALSAAAAESVPDKASPLLFPFTATQAQAGQQAWAKSFGKPVVDKNTLGMEFVLIPPGTFTMGSPPAEKDRRDDETQVQVTLTEAIWLSKTEVTQGQWTQVMGTIPWTGAGGIKDYAKEGPDYAACYLSWNAAQEFLKTLSQRDGSTYRLPTEAEWEWSCRAGTSSPWSFGEKDGDLSQYGWYGGVFGEGNAQPEQYPHPVSQKLANPFGLDDMHGNVLEWCEDVYVAKRLGGTNPHVTTGSNFHVLRGGSWNYPPRNSRTSQRSKNLPDARSYNGGFRVVRTQ